MALKILEQCTQGTWVIETIQDGEYPIFMLNSTRQICRQWIGDSPKDATDKEEMANFKLMSKSKEMAALLDEVIESSGNTWDECQNRIWEIDKDTIVKIKSFLKTLEI